MGFIEPKYNKSFYMITGGPGVGKTTLLEELKNRNHQIVPEIAREIIKEQPALIVKLFPGRTCIYIKNNV